MILNTVSTGNTGEFLNTVFRGNTKKEFERMSDRYVIEAPAATGRGIEQCPRCPAGRRLCVR